MGEKHTCCVFINIIYNNTNRILTSSSSALGDFFAFGAERQNNYNNHKLHEWHYHKQQNSLQNIHLNTNPTIQSYDKETEVTFSGTFQYLIQYNQCMRVGEATHPKTYNLYPPYIKSMFVKRWENVFSHSISLVS